MIVDVNMKNKEILMTGLEWASQLFIDIVNPTGWHDDKQYRNKKITKHDFCYRAANSVIAPQNKSRRDVNKYKELISKTNK